jgi:hypothetical protein
MDEIDMGIMQQRHPGYQVPVYFRIGVQLPLPEALNKASSVALHHFRFFSLTFTVTFPTYAFLIIN